MATVLPRGIMASRDLPYRRRYRREGVLRWRGEIFAMPKWLDFVVDDEKPRRVESLFALTERGIRRKLARALWRRTHPEWNV